MSDEVRSYQATFPAGTSQSTPLTVAISFPPRVVNTLEIIVPPGPSGLMGFRISMGGVPVLPIQANTWLVTDDDKIVWPLDGFPTSGAWQIQGYNTDEYDHSVYLRWLVSQVGSSTQSGLSAPPTLASFNPAPTADAALSGEVML